MPEYRRRYDVSILLVADKPHGLPDHADAEELIFSQMEGELNETTGLFCGMVEVTRITEDPSRVWNIDSSGEVQAPESEHKEQN